LLEASSFRLKTHTLEQWHRRLNTITAPLSTYWPRVFKPPVPRNSFLPFTPAALISLHPAYPSLQ
jgi:hypothetical protein